MKNSNIKYRQSLQNHSVINSIILASIVIITSLFFFIPYITEQYTIKTIIKHSKTAVEQIKLTRAYYVDVVVKDVKKYAPNLEFHYDHWGVDGRLPLPTTTVYDLSEIFSEQTGMKYNLYSDYPFLNRKDRVLTPFQKDAIKYTQENEDGTYIKRDIIDGKEVLRVATTDYMTDKSCVTCHNDHADRTWEKGKWNLGDKRGVLEVITPLEEELAGHIVMRNYIILFIVVVISLVLFYLFIKIRKREDELISVAGDLIDEVGTKDKELKSLGRLVDKYIISSKTDKAGIITYVSKAFVDISGYPERELLNQPHSIIRHPDMPKSSFKDMWDTIENGKVWKGEVKNLTKNGDFYWVNAVISPDYDNEGSIIGYSALRTDITAQKKSQYLASHDPLTSLANRHRLEDIAGHAIKVAKRDKTSLAILFLDFDKFKNINDTLGHQAGDQLLITVANRMLSVLREVDTIARIGGDEFVILLESITDTKDVSNIVNNILDVIREPISLSSNEVYITASIGISIFPNDGVTVSELMKNADSAMYHVKEIGKNNYQFFKEEINSKISRVMSIEKTLRDAIDKNGFDFVFQPQYKLKGQNCMGAELLIRLTSDELGFISPAEFIPIAEDNNMINDITDIAFKEAVRVFKNLKELDLSLEHIAVNISSINLKQKNIVKNFSQIVKDSGLSANNIELELTEHSLMENIDENIETLNKFRKLGFLISIDDFGTGYSSMSYLKRLPIDTIKIDKSFIDNIDKNKDDLAIAHVVIQLCKDLDYMVVAEGIEKSVQQDILMEMGCHLGQGYLYSKPLNYDDLVEFIKRDK